MKSARSTTGLLALAILFAFGGRALADSAQANQSIDLGDQWMQKKEYDKAIADYSEAIRLDPENARAFNNRGYASYQKKQYARAVEDYTEAIRLNPRYEYAFTNRADALHMLGKHDESTRDLDRVLEINPLAHTTRLLRACRLCIQKNKESYAKAVQDFDILVETYRNAGKGSQLLLRLSLIFRGNTLCKLGNYAGALANQDELMQAVPGTHSRVGRALIHLYFGEKQRALVELEEMFRLDPKVPSILSEHGSSHFQDEFHWAIAAFDAALHLDPKNKQVFASRGKAWRMKSDYEKARADLDEALRIDPKFLFAREERGLVWKAKQDYDRAIDDFTAILELEPKHRFALCERSHAWRIKKDNAKALADLEVGLRHYPKDVWLFNERGQAWLDQKEYDKAIADFDAALRIDPKYKWAYYNRGRTRGNWTYYHRGSIRYRQGQHEAAVADLTEAIRLDPNYEHALNERGWVRLDQKEYDQAIADFDAALRINPKYEWAHLNRGQARCRLGQHDNAIADLTEAIRLDPKLVWAYSQRARAHCALGELDKALADFQKAIQLHSAKLGGSPIDGRDHGGLAWILATCPIDNRRDGKKAIKLATRSCELDQWTFWGSLNALAAAYAEVGDFAKAIDYQTRALALMAPGFYREQAEGRLEQYRREQPHRDPENPPAVPAVSRQ